MNRVQKKCFVFSVGMHCLLLVILLGSAAFRNRTEETEMPILSLIPANIIDAAGAGGGQPAPAAQPTQPQAAVQQQVQPPTPRPRTEPQVTVPQPAQRVERQKPQETEVETPSVVSTDTSTLRPAKTHHQHEIHPTFTTAAQTSSHTKPKPKPDNSEASSKAAARSEARRLNEIANSLDHLASGVQTSGAARTVVDVQGIGGGGEVFAGYNTVVKSYYTRSWIPFNRANRSVLPEAQIVVARDGTVIQADLVSPSGEASLDKSVLRVLEAVKKLPPFPASAHDEQRTFRIQFDPTQAPG